MCFGPHPVISSSGTSWEWVNRYRHLSFYFANGVVVNTCHPVRLPREEEDYNNFFFLQPVLCYICKSPRAVEACNVKQSNSTKPHNRAIKFQR